MRNTAAQKVRFRLGAPGDRRQVAWNPCRECRWAADGGPMAADPETAFDTYFDAAGHRRRSMAQLHRGPRATTSTRMRSAVAAACRARLVRRLLRQVRKVPVRDLHQRRRARPGRATMRPETTAAALGAGLSPRSRTSAPCRGLRRGGFPCSRPPATGRSASRRPTPRATPGDGDGSALCPGVRSRLEERGVRPGARARGWRPR